VREAVGGRERREKDIGERERGGKGTRKCNIELGKHRARARKGDRERERERERKSESVKERKRDKNVLDKGRQREKIKAEVVM